MNHHILTVLVENKFGVLARVAGLFSRRGYNIFSLAVSPTEDERFSRMTVVVDGDSAPIEQITKQLNKLIPVVKVTELASSEAVERELMLATVKASAEFRSQVTELASIFEAKILDVGIESMTLMVAGAPDTLDAITDLLTPFGVVELAGHLRAVSTASIVLEQKAHRLIHSEHICEQRGRSKHEPSNHSCGAAGGIPARRHPLPSMC